MWPNESMRRKSSRFLPRHNFILRSTFTFCALFYQGANNHFAARVLCCSFMWKHHMHVNRFFFSMKVNPHSSTHIALVLVYIIAHTINVFCSRALFYVSPFFFFFYEDCLGVEQQMQTLNSKSYKADIISGNIEADREAIEMQIDCWGRGSRGKEIGRDDNASKPLQFVKKATLCHKTGDGFQHKCCYSAKENNIQK